MDINPILLCRMYTWECKQGHEALFQYRPLSTTVSFEVFGHEAAIFDSSKLHACCDAAERPFTKYGSEQKHADTCCLFFYIPAFLLLLS